MALLLTLWFADRLAALVLLPYVLYLGLPCGGDDVYGS
jgi:hypothetical protein